MRDKRERERVNGGEKNERKEGIKRERGVRELSVRDSLISEGALHRVS